MDPDRGGGRQSPGISRGRDPALLVALPVLVKELAPQQPRRIIRDTPQPLVHRLPSLPFFRREVSLRRRAWLLAFRLALPGLRLACRFRAVVLRRLLGLGTASLCVLRLGRVLVVSGRCARLRLLALPLNPRWPLWPVFSRALLGGGLILAAAPWLLLTAARLGALVILRFILGFILGLATLPLLTLGLPGLGLILWVPSLATPIGLVLLTLGRLAGLVPGPFARA
jgi:hypothetical protein